MGFDPTEYVVGETDGEVTLFVVILEGSLQRMVTVQFETLPGTATQSGMYHVHKVKPTAQHSHSYCLSSLCTMYVELNAYSC